MIMSGLLQMANADPSRIAILVGEDEALIRRLIRCMLERSQFDVFEAGTARHGLSLLQSHPEIQLAILDMVMPGMSGLDLAAEMSRHHRNTKILYITGYVGSIAMEAIADRHPDAVLFKPFTEPQLIARVCKLLNLCGDTSDTAWERLIEGSDVVPRPQRIATYRNTRAAYAIAAAHAAVLRRADISYRFSQLPDPSAAQMPFQLAAPAEYWKSALDCISVLGLGADATIGVAPAVLPPGNS
jgi:CheY-like chemotaxis protein